MLDWNIIFLLLSNTIELSAPLLLAAMGGLLSERSGVINIALEGMMLAAACATSLAAVATGNALVGLMAGLGIAILIGIIHAILTQAYKIHHIVSGMALNAIAIGGTSFLDKKLMDPTVIGDVPGYPFGIYIILALIIPLILFVYIKVTRGGLHLLAVGNDPEKARIMGVDPIKVRYFALGAAGLVCGLAGTMMVSSAGRFSDNMTAGRGFIALAAVILGSWKPIQTGIACLLFGLLSALDLQLQGTTVFNYTLPSQFWNSLPYIATIIALAGFMGKNNSAPAGIGKE